MSGFVVVIGELRCALSRKARSRMCEGWQRSGLCRRRFAHSHKEQGDTEDAESPNRHKNEDPEHEFLALPLSSGRYFVVFNCSCSLKSCIEEKYSMQ